MSKKMDNYTLLKKIKEVPVTIYLITIIFFAMPFLLEYNFFNVDLNHMQFFLLIIPTFFWTYYIGLAAGLFGALISNILFLGYEWFEIAYIGTLYSRNELYHILMIAIINFLIPIGVGFLANLLIKQRELIKENTITDPLTRLYNRRHLLDKLKSIKKDDRAALIFIDLDDYKIINDSYGHEVGDILLEEIGNRLSKIAKAEIPVRLGGDEFVILITNDVEQDNINYISNCVKQIIAKPFEIKGHSLCITASIGVSVYPEHTDCPEQLINTADIAMYHAKNSGKDKIEVYNDTIKDSTIEKCINE